MGNPKGFINIKRKKAEYRPVCERIKDYGQVTIPRSTAQSAEQASRCMDCGTPFCHWGCPVGNYIPEWNDLVTNKYWERAYELLSATNNLPEVTGRVCPANCEAACVLGVNDDPVTIRENELAVIEYAYKHGLVKPDPPKVRTGKKVAVVGSGPAGLSAADQLNRKGHLVKVYEKDDKLGGIMRYGIPDFKLEKDVLDRRIEIFKKEGITFQTGVIAEPEQLKDEYDAVVVATGARTPRDLKIPGRDLNGIHFALDYLTRSNMTKLPEAQGKRVVVIGGADTGADCVGTAIRQGASCVLQIEILPQPAVVKTLSSHEEGCQRKWCVQTNEFIGMGNEVRGMKCMNVDTKEEFTLEADMILLAMGFLKEEIKTDPGIFVAGDARRGPSLIVWAIWEGRQAAEAVDKYLKENK